MTRIAVTGSRGRLGSYLVNKCGLYPIRADVTDPNELCSEILNINPEVIIHCAAYTDVDGAEQDYERAYLTNVIGTSYLRKMFSGLIVFISTSFIFDGHSQEPYSEKDFIYRAVNAYGWTKVLGEIILDSSPEPYKIIRTVSLYGPDGKDFMENLIVRLGWEKEPVYLPSNLIRAPTYIPHLAEAIFYILDNNLEENYFNITGETVLSLYDLGTIIGEMFDFKLSRRLKVGTDIETIAQRPKMGALNLRTAWKLGVPTYTLEEGLACLVKEADYL